MGDMDDPVEPALVSWAGAVVMVEQAWQRLGRQVRAQPVAEELFDRIRLWLLEPIGTPADVASVRAHASLAVRHGHEPAALGRVRFRRGQLRGLLDQLLRPAARAVAVPPAVEPGHPGVEWAEVIGFVAERMFMDGIERPADLARALREASRTLHEAGLSRRGPMSESTSRRIAEGWLRGSEAWRRYPRTIPPRRPI